MFLGVLATFFNFFIRTIIRGRYDDQIKKEIQFHVHIQGTKIGLRTYTNGVFMCPMTKHGSDPIRMSLWDVPYQISH